LKEVNDLKASLNKTFEEKTAEKNALQESA